MRFIFYMLITIGILPSTINAKELIVLYDGGKSTVFNKGMDHKIRLERPDPMKVMESRFPITSKLWSLGEFESVKIHFPEMRSPIFLIGCDDLSFSWVQQRSEYFILNRALGFVINCPTFDDYTAFKVAIYPLVIQAANMDKLSIHLKHNQYPAYIQNRAIEQ